MAKIEGLERFQRRLSTVPKAARDELRKALEQSAEEVVSHMKRLVPVVTGELQMSIGWTWGEAPKGAMIIARSRASAFTKAAAGAGMVITIYAAGGETWWGRLIEFGKGPLRKGRSPFFYPVWRIYKKRVKSRIARATKKAVKAAA